MLFLEKILSYFPGLFSLKRHRPLSSMPTKRFRFFFFLYLLAAFAVAAPPPGFTALFNGTDLTGWRGGDTYDHRKLLALPPAERDALVAKWTASLTEQKNGKPHWSVDRGELLNDGLGGYATTERDYGDFELYGFLGWERSDSGCYAWYDAKRFAERAGCGTLRSSYAERPG